MHLVLPVPACRCSAGWKGEWFQPARHKQQGTRTAQHQRQGTPIAQHLHQGIPTASDKLQGTPFAQDQHQNMELRTWRSLPDFIEKCDFLALPPAGTAGASSAAHTAEGNANSSTPGTWPAEQRMPPASIAELLGFDDPTGTKGIQKLEAAAEAGELVPGAARRNESHIVAALHQLTDVTQAGQAVAGHDLHCWACTQPSGTEALRACRSRGRARKKPNIGARVHKG